MRIWNKFQFRTLFRSQICLQDQPVAQLDWAPCYFHSLPCLAMYVALYVQVHTTFTYICGSRNRTGPGLRSFLSTSSFSRKLILRSFVCVEEALVGVQAFFSLLYISTAVCPIFRQCRQLSYKLKVESLVSQDTLSSRLLSLEGIHVTLFRGEK